MPTTTASISSGELLAEFSSITRELVDTIGRFNHDDFNMVPFEGSWTAGQVSEHLYKSLQGLPQLLVGNSKRADRNPDEKIETLRSIFLDFTTKLKSPDFILPTDGIKETTYFMEGFNKLDKDLSALVPSLDLSLLLTDFPFPQIGELSGYEWLFFSICHAKRHKRQIGNIYAALHS